MQDHPLRVLTGHARHLRTPAFCSPEHQMSSRRLGAFAEGQTQTDGTYHIFTQNMLWVVLLSGEHSSGITGP